MKRLAFMIAVCYISCQQSENDKLSENLRIYCEGKVKDIDSLNHLDSMRVIKIDTITQRDILIFKSNKTLKRNDSLKSELEYLSEKFNTNYKLAKLSSGISSTLFDNYKTEALDNNTKLQNIIILMKANLSKSDSLLKLAKTADSISPVHFQAISLIQYTRKDRSVYRDTAYVDLNIEKQIVRPADMNKLYYSID
jgi:hypothetical protein